MLTWLLGFLDRIHLNRVQQTAKSLRDERSILTIKFPGVPGTHFINLRRTEGKADLTMIQPKRFEPEPGNSDKVMQHLTLRPSEFYPFKQTNDFLFFLAYKNSL